MVIRKTSSFLHRRRGVKKTFSLEPMNLKGVNSFRYNGLIHRKDLGVQPAKDGKGVTLLYKTSRNQRKPAQVQQSLTLKKGGRRTLRTIRNFCTKGNYRASLNKLAMRRASQILRGQRPKTKKARSDAKPKA